MNVCPICEASLIHHTLYNRKFGHRVYMYLSRISLLGGKKITKKVARHCTDFEADRWPETGDFLGGLKGYGDAVVTTDNLNAMFGPNIHLESFHYNISHF